MKTIIHGLIKVKETHIPIPGLIVSIFGETTMKPSKASKTSTTSNKKESKTFSKKSDELISGIKSGKTEQISFGSVITNRQGQFQLEIDLHNFPYAKDHNLFKLFLGIYAPLGSKLNTKITPKLENHLLDKIVLPEKNMGEKEAIVVLIEKDKLVKYGITTDKNKPPVKKKSIDESVATYVKIYTDKKELQQKLRKEMLPFHKANFSKNKAKTEKAKKFVNGLSAVSRDVRESDHFVDKQSDVKVNMRAVMDKELTKWSNHSDPADGSKFLFKIDLDIKKDLAKKGFSFPINEEEIDHQLLCKIMNAKRGGFTLERVRNMIDAVHDELKVKEITEDVEDTATPGDGHEPGTDINGLFPENILYEKTIAQITAIGETNGEAVDWTSETDEEIRKKMDKFNISTNITENPAFHDFHSLQIAFQHVWAEAFDQAAKEDLITAYNLIVDLHDEYLAAEDYDEDHPPFELPEELSELEDLQMLYHTISSISGSIGESLPLQITSYFPDIDGSLWAQLSTGQQMELINIVEALDDRSLDGIINLDFGGAVAVKIEIKNGVGSFEWSGQKISVEFDSQDPGGLIATDATLLEKGNDIINNPKGNLHRVQRLLKETIKRLTEPYSFQYFAPNSVNFGILSTYRQTWIPRQYQAGDLVATIPLAPGEKRKFSTKHNIKRTRAEKELDKSLISRTKEMKNTQRADEEITAKAAMNSNFELNAQGAFRFLFGDISASTQFSLEQSRESSYTKKGFREAVVNAAEKYKNERSLEISTTDEFTSEITSSGELSNPNNEITVTYLLYELERLYEISERIHKVTPVILVAQDIPAPNDITEGWLIAHEWILRRVLLDDHLIPALNYLTDTFAGEGISVKVHEANWKKQNELVAKLEGTVATHLAKQNTLQTSLISTEKEHGLSEEEGALGDINRLIDDTYIEKLLRLEIDASEAPEILEVKRKAIESELNYLTETLRSAQDKLSRAAEALNQATQSYTNAVERQSNRRVGIDQLRVHIKQNILYYMQAIWDHEPPDQRFFRLQHIEVQLPESSETTCVLRKATQEEIDAHYPIYKPDDRPDVYVIVSCDPPALPTATDENVKRLIEIADLDHPLGYKGNYMIFPLKTCTHLTNFMMKDFFNEYFGLRDPDETANYTVDELVRYTEILTERGELTDEQVEVLGQMLTDKLNNPRRDSELVVIPTGNLFMEALTGSQPLLEEFKMRHRKIDVEKVKAEVRQQELENLRRAARLLKDEPDLTDPDVDKHIVVEGDSEVHVEVP